MNTTQWNRWRGRLLTVVWSAALFFAAAGPLCAQDEKEDTEPIWVISWAVFYLFLALTIILLSRSTKRVDSRLNEEQTKEYEEALIQKRADLFKDDEEPEDDDDD